MLNNHEEESGRSIPGRKRSMFKGPEVGGMEELKKERKALPVGLNHKKCGESGTRWDQGGRQGRQISGFGCLLVKIMGSL